MFLFFQAFVLMESYQKAQDVFKAAKDCLTLNGCKLSVEIISSGVVMTTVCQIKTVDIIICFQHVVNDFAVEANR